MESKWLHTVFLALSSLRGKTSTCIKSEVNLETLSLNKRLTLQIKALKADGEKQVGRKENSEDDRWSKDKQIQTPETDKSTGSGRYKGGRGGSRWIYSMRPTGRETGR